MSLDIYLTNKKCETCGVAKEIDFDFNMTHNLNKMATKCGLYRALWRPDELGIKQAKYLIPLLQDGIENLKEHKAVEFRDFVARVISHEYDHLSGICAVGNLYEEKKNKKNVVVEAAK